MRRVQIEFTRWQLTIMDMVAEGMSITQIARATCRSSDAIKRTKMRIRALIGLPTDRNGYLLLKWLSDNGWDVREELLSPQDKYYIRKLEKSTETHTSRNLVHPDTSIST